MIKKFKVDEPNLDLNTNKVEIRKLPPLLKPFDFYKTIEIYLEEVLSKYYIQGKIKYSFILKKESGIKNTLAVIWSFELVRKWQNFYLVTRKYFVMREDNTTNPRSKNL